MTMARIRKTERKARPSRLVSYLYIPTLFILALSGFGQMPIYNRYYLSDIPGLGWLAYYYVTRNIHYVAAAVLLGLIFYGLFDFLFSHRRRLRLTKSGILRAALLAGIVVSGALIVVKNFPYVYFSDGFIIGLDIFHIAAVMTFLLANLVCLLGKMRWTAAR
jgi:hypothetical protein